ncbi:MAG: hypothetical protein JO165_08850, partial [Candidatus Eremiobacteraeota bacterium]|nr:hypothetical protein [Candidatus Eremiobacteraeota bacterium]
MRALTWCFVMFCLAMPAACPAAGANDDLLARIATSSAALQKAAAHISKIATTEETWDYVYRLQNDTSLLNRTSTPAGYRPQEFSDMARTTAQLDLSLADQLVNGKRFAIDSTPGVQARFVLSSADGSWQPVAIFIPKSYGSTAVPLVVFLHGYQQTETQLLGWQTLRDLADETGSIVVAPYGRGYSDFHGVAVGDVDDGIAAVESALHVDKGRL